MSETREPICRSCEYYVPRYMSLTDGFCMHSPPPCDGQRKYYDQPACVWYKPRETQITMSSKKNGGAPHVDETDR